MIKENFEKRFTTAPLKECAWCKCEIKGKKIMIDGRGYCKRECYEELRLVHAV